jgi:hypothetical protein
VTRRLTIEERAARREARLRGEPLPPRVRPPRRRSPIPEHSPVWCAPAPIEPDEIAAVQQAAQTERTALQVTNVKFLRLLHLEMLKQVRRSKRVEAAHGQKREGATP